MSKFTIPGFELIECIGQGGMATVWKARQLSLNRIVAVKVLSPRLTQSADNVERFHKECQTAGRMKDSGIIQVHDANVHEGLYYLVMEFVDGYTVGAWLARKQVLPEDDILKIAGHVVTALSHAWNSAKLIHCDLKPDNVMVDADGTIKVADLGIAKMLDMMSHSQKSDDVMGTPYYMSPEQAMGVKELDCRADIYALGAMCYHLATGHMPFEDVDEAEAMEQQVNGKLADALDLNPKLTQGFCWMLEKALVKNREKRMASWEAFRQDIDLVAQKLPPAPPYPLAGESTMARSTRRTKPVAPAAPPKLAPPGKKSINLVAAISMGVVLAGAIFIAGQQFRKQAGDDRVVNLTNSPALVAASNAAVAAQSAGRENAAREMHEYAAAWAAAHSNQYADAISRFEEVARQTRGSKYSLMAAESIAKLRADLQAAIKAVMDGLRQQAEALASGKNYAGAAKVFEEYYGPLARESEAVRRRLAEEYRQRATQEAKDEQAAGQALAKLRDTVVDRVAVEIARGSLTAASEALGTGLVENEKLRKDPTLLGIKSLLDETARVPQKILVTFQEQAGQELVVDFMAGPKSVLIKSVSVLAGEVRGEQRLRVGSGMAASELRFQLDDLAPREKLNRLGTNETPDIVLAKGLMAIQVRSPMKAREFFVRLPPPLGERIAAAMEQDVTQQQDDIARRALLSMLKTAGIPTEQFQKEECLAAIASLQPDLSLADAIKVGVAHYRDSYGQTRFCAEAEPVLAALASRFSPAAPARAAMAADTPPSDPAGESALAEALVAKNPNLTPSDVEVRQNDQGDITGIRIRSLALSNIEPLTAVAKTLKDLLLTDSSVKDLTPLHGMALRTLMIPGCKAWDFDALRGMPLETLDLNKTDFRDSAILAGMPLRSLELKRTKITTIASLGKMPLQVLDISETGVRDLTILSGLPLKTLRISGLTVRDLTFLRSSKLEELACANTTVADLQPLRGLPLRELNIAGTKVIDLGPLARLPLEVLTLTGTGVKDLSPIKDCPLKQLFCQDTKITDLTPVKGMPIESLAADGTMAKLGPIVRSLPNIQDVNGIPLATPPDRRRPDRGAPPSGPSP